MSAQQATDQSDQQLSHRIPAEFLRAGLAPAPRTLVDILEATAAQHPDATAIDDGAAPLTYRELLAEIDAGARGLADAGVGAGDRVGVRMPSGSRDLYVAILSVLAAGAAYVPVDADDPDERAELVFGEARVAAILTADGVRPGTAPRRTEVPQVRPPTPDDDAWIIFTSGSTGTPKGVAVTHRNAAAFVDAEARMFLQGNPINPATGCWRGCRWRSTRRARRCGWRGGTAPRWCPHHARWYAAAWISDRGWSPATSRSSPPFRRSLPCGRRRHSRRCGC